MIRRVKRGKVARIRRAKVLSLRAGAIGSNSRVFRIAQENRIRSISFSCIDRKARKRKYRSLWLLRVHARARSIGKKYSYLIYNIRQRKCILNRKVLAQLALLNPKTFYHLVNVELISQKNITQAYFITMG